MEHTIVERIRSSLADKKSNLKTWLRTTTPEKRQIALGTESDAAVHVHLDMLDKTIIESSSDTFGKCTECGEFVEEEQLAIDYTRCVCLAHLSTEQTQELERELEHAQIVQRQLLPQKPRDIPGLEVAAFSRPAQFVGGDYFDYFEYQDGTNGVAVADVAGHGVSASLLMASVQTLLRSLAPVSSSPLEVMRQIHHLYQHNIRFTTFVTLFLGAFDLDSRTFFYCNAGHNPPMLIRKTASDEEGKVEWLMPTGPAVGLVEDAEYLEKKVKLLPGDLLVMYTDGVPEAINLASEEFGMERFADLIHENSDLPVSQIIHNIRHVLGEFTNGQPLADDTTIVIYRVVEP